MSQIREDFVDPEVVWDPELSSPIPKVIGGLLVLAFVFGFSAVAIAANRTWVIVTLVGVVYGSAQVVQAAKLLAAYRRYESWMASPQSPPSHAVSRAIGAVLIAIIAIGFVLCCVAWFAQ